MATPARRLAVPPPTCRTSFPTPATLALAALVWCALAVNPVGAAMTVVGEPAGDFRLTDLQGRAVHLQQLLEDRSALVLFSSVGCIPCEESAPAVQRVAERFADRLEVLCVMLSEPSMVRHWLASGARYPGARILVGPDGSAPYATAREYGVLGTPTAFLIGQDGSVQWRHVGRITTEQLDDVLPGILATAAPDTASDILALRGEP
ncbi:MAG: TlpA disulfide reductase family protein [Deferrisomatales bacterium]|nr:TlpA disulfide reductase family protein [Deferrisomatales bacterium]